MRPFLFWALSLGIGVAVLQSEEGEPETCQTVKELPRDRFAAGAGSREVLSPCKASLCRTKSCVHCALKPGQRLRTFVELLQRREGTDESVKLLTLGNSVARRHKYATTRSLMDTLEKMFPRVHWEYETGKVEGGFEPAHMYNAIQARPWEYSKYDIFMVQYLGFADKKNAEELIRLLLDMERKPLVILVQHCIKDSFEPGHASGEGHDFWVKQERQMFELAEHYSLPLVSACNAMRAMVADKSEMNLHSLFKVMFDKEDDFHYVESAEVMEGCLVADMIASAAASKLYARLADPEELPAPIGLLEDSKCVFMNSTMDKRFWPNITGESWEFKTGGKGGNKRWLQPKHDNALLSFIAPPSTSISLEVYKHHERPMGAVEVSVDGRVVAQVDACCPVPCVGIPGQGFYYTQEVAAGLSLAEHLVEIRSVKKSDTSCLKLGNEFSLVGIIGYVQSERRTGTPGPAPLVLPCVFCPKVPDGIHVPYSKWKEIMHRRHTLTSTRIHKESFH